MFLNSLYFCISDSFAILRNRNSWLFCHYFHKKRNEEKFVMSFDPGTKLCMGL